MVGQTALSNLSSPSVFSLSLVYACMQEKILQYVWYGIDRIEKSKYSIDYIHNNNNSYMSDS